MFKNLPGLLIGTILLILGFMFSIVIISIIALIGLGFWSYFWWKTRALRQGMQKHMPRQESDGQIIDGEALLSKIEYDVGSSGGVGCR